MDVEMSLVPVMLGGGLFVLVKLPPRFPATDIIMGCFVSICLGHITQPSFSTDCSDCKECVQLSNCMFQQTSQTCCEDLM